MEILKKLKKKSEGVFYGSRSLAENRRLSFKHGILKTTIARFRVAIFLLFLLEVSNLLFSASAEARRPYTDYLFKGVCSLIALCVVSFILCWLCDKNVIKGYLIKKLLVMSTLAIGMGCTLFFCYAELAETKSVSNYTLVILACSIIPVLNIYDHMLVLVPYAAVNIYFARILGCEDYVIRQMLILLSVSFYASISQYAYSRRSFNEETELFESNRLLEQLAQTDQLTGLLNRRGLYSQLPRIASPSGRGDENVSALMIDIDYFKEYNDRYLHIGGDECLAKISACLKGCARRSTDIIARYGGEEFVVITRGMSREKLLGFALQIRASVKELKIPFGYLDFPHVTISIGVADMPENTKGMHGMVYLTSLLGKADKELYRAKDSGRDCVCFEGNIYRSMREIP